MNPGHRPSLKCELPVTLGLNLDINYKQGCGVCFLSLRIFLLMHFVTKNLQSSRMCCRGCEGWRSASAAPPLCPGLQMLRCGKLSWWDQSPHTQRAQPTPHIPSAGFSSPSGLIRCFPGKGSMDSQYPFCLYFLTCT